MTGVANAPWRESFEFDRSDVGYLKVWSLRVWLLLMSFSAETNDDVSLKVKNQTKHEGDYKVYVRPEEDAKLKVYIEQHNIDEEVALKKP